MSRPEARVLKVGDVVELMSGGPTMTVDKIEEDGNLVRCIWFDDAGQLQCGTFRMNTLSWARGE